MTRERKRQLRAEVYDCAARILGDNIVESPEEFSAQDVERAFQSAVMERLIRRLENLGRISCDLGGDER